MRCQSQIHSLATDVALLLMYYKGNDMPRVCSEVGVRAALGKKRNLMGVQQGSSVYGKRDVKLTKTLLLRKQNGISDDRMHRHTADILTIRDE